MSNEVDVSKLTFEVTERIRGYLKNMLDMGGSDLHIKANSHVRARVNGEIVSVSTEILSKPDALTFAKELLRGRFSEFVEKKELDLIYIYDEKIRFRVNIFFQIDGVSAVFRAISDKKTQLSEIGMPEAIFKIPQFQRGLVLVTGITGSGKSTTLASIIHEINTTQRKHIITIEDPIEFVHKDELCIINQRSIGQDSHSFSNALRSALREDPDIILVGEMRDAETIEMAIHAAETGHLVLSTLHTIDAKETIKRILGVFPPHRQELIRASLASALMAIVSQRLVKTQSHGRFPAIELLFKTPRIEALIAEDRDDEIFGTLSEGKSQYGTQTFDQSLLDLYLSGKITQDEALQNATSPSDLKLKMSNSGLKSEDGSSKTSIKLKI